MPLPRLVLALGLALVACSESKKPTLPDTVVGHCTYVNRFSDGNECREYLGDWSEAKATEDCAGQKGTFGLGTGCEAKEADVLGWCLIDDPGAAMKVSFLDTNADNCGTSRTGCEVFAGGFFDPSPTCGGAAGDTGSSLPVFRQPVRICKDPKPGEPPGKSENGQVCTWQIISGATEEGRTFSDYADCDAVRTQRPYWPAAEDDHVKDADPRMNDPAFAAEVEWVRSQARASACICCHSNAAPRGASNWNLDTPGNFANGFHARGLAMGAGWIDTAGFGAYPASENNGFSRPTPEDTNHSIVPTTDSARMVRFFLGELAHRGVSQDDYAGQPHGAGPLDEQRFYKPEACADGEAIGADGRIRWKIGKARYVYVLEEGATSPTVPPNLDLPAGTLWRVDVPETGAALANGTVTYGTVPGGAVQKFPAQGAPAKLVSGKRYYLYVLADIAQPIARCLVTAP